MKHSLAVAEISHKMEGKGPTTSNDGGARAPLIPAGETMSRKTKTKNKTKITTNKTKTRKTRSSRAPEVPLGSLRQETPKAHMQVSLFLSVSFPVSE